MDKMNLNDNFRNEGYYRSELEEEGRDRAQVRWFERRWSYMFNEYPSELLGNSAMRLEETVKKRMNENRVAWWLITLNVRDGTEINEMQVCIDKTVDKCWLRKWVYCWEWGKMNEHVHIHLICLKNKAKSTVIRELFSTWKHTMGSKEAINVRGFTNKDYDKVLKYINKDDIGTVDKRGHLGLDNLYYEHRDLYLDDEEKKEEEDIDLIMG